MSLEPVNNKEEFDSILHSNAGKLIVVDFYADWCGPCKLIAPKFLDLAKEFKEVIALKVDVDEGEEIASACGISAMPTFKAYRDGQVLETLVGNDKTKLRALFELKA